MKCKNCDKPIDKKFKYFCQKHGKIEQLANRLEGLANSLRNEFIPLEGAYGTLLIHLESSGYLTKKEEHYIRQIK